MPQEIKKQAVLAIFGDYYGNKLINSLSDCCQPRILVNFNATCNGFDPMGNPQYNIVASIIYKANITGYTAVSYYISNQPFPNIATPINTGTFILGNITSGNPIVLANVTVSNPAPGNFYLMITDNRGNYSYPFTATFPNCPKI